MGDLPGREAAPPLTEFRRGLLAHDAGDLAAAERSYRQAMAEPKIAVAVRQHLVRLLDLQGRWDEAVDVRRDIVAAQPDDALARMNLGMSLLALGRFAEGWPLYEARSELPAAAAFRPSVDSPEWDGGPVRSLTVWDEQGVGDAIQFARFVPVLRDRGIDATLIARPPVAALMGELKVPVIRAEGQMRIPVTDAWSMLGSLPHRLGLTLDQLPGLTPYLRAPADRRAAWTPRIGPGVRIGVVARGNPQHANDANRSLHAEAASFLHALPGAISLIPGESPLPIADFADTAAIIERLDLVITVDTATAHLAGAMGRPCWVLLPAVGTDWRWMRERTDSPWYPSVRLFRQAQPGSWAEVLRALATNLQAFFQPGPAGAPRS
ncbi:hypothetical protein DJ021_09175 [Phenylobacterium hankyongense]|uniref:Uncharacterized protein n=1 Tax=Phenylobacterium hankyongense TaxID=1813876 RepID=A0A328AXX5_9CAUL|nr:tetratricopeptide repeat protein [Phenylobacterium hankyongense]RAK59962.1 hypothetical protein DJ021_09175 [Phenylobacterium hankyongense]